MAPMRGIARVLGVVAVVLLAGSGTAHAAVPIVNPIDPNAMDPCNQAPLAFNGTTTVAALGLADQFGGGPDVNKPGHIWITADPFVPEGWSAPGEPPPPPMRFVCVEFDDGSGMAGSIDPNWQMPSLLSGGEAEPDEGPPLATIGMVGLLLAGVVISILAFRRP